MGFIISTIKARIKVLTFGYVPTFGEVQAFWAHFAGSGRSWKASVYNVIDASACSIHVLLKYMALYRRGGGGGLLWVVCLFGYCLAVGGN